MRPLGTGQTATTAGKERKEKLDLVHHTLQVLAALLRISDSVQRLASDSCRCRFFLGAIMYMRSTSKLPRFFTAKEPSNALKKLATVLLAFKNAHIQKSSHSLSHPSKLASASVHKQHVADVSISSRQLNTCSTAVCQQSAQQTLVQTKLQSSPHRRIGFQRGCE